MMHPSRDPHSVTLWRITLWRTRPRLRAATAALALLLLGAALAADGARTAAVMARATAARIREWSSFESALVRSGSGREGLPPAVTATVGNLIASGAATFRQSEALIANDFLKQRIAEVAWPLAIDPAAGVVVRLADEPASCTPLAQTDGVAVDRCN